MPQVQGLKAGDWAPLLARLPGDEPKPVGVLLVDTADDRLYVRLLDSLGVVDDDVLLVWEEMAAELQQMAQEMGGRRVLDWLDENASHVFSIGSLRHLVMSSPEAAVNRLFLTQVVPKTPPQAAVKPAVAVLPSLPSFSRQDLLAARHRLPGSPANTLRALAALGSSHVSFSRLEQWMEQDPTLTAHLLKLANSVMFYAGGEIRTVTQAILHIGVDRAVRHLSALELKRFFRSPQLQKVWNHSIIAGHVSRQLARLCRYPEPEELLLLGLVHDIGQILLESL